MSESKIMREAWAAMVKAGAKVWRNNVGLGVVGPTRWMGRTATVYPANPIHFGLCVGSSDLVGHLPVTVTQDMVGHKVAIAVYAEAKTEDGRITPQQAQFIETAKADGAISFAFRSVDEAVENLRF